MLRTCGLVIAVALRVGACDGSSSSSVTTVDPVPRSLHIEYGLGTEDVGVPYGPYPPAGNGTVTGYAVSPAKGHG